MLFIAFLHVPMSSHLLGFSTPFLAASPQLLALPPLHLQRRKTKKGGEAGGKLWVEGRWKGWIWLERLGEDDARVMRGWSEVGAMVE